MRSNHMLAGMETTFDEDNLVPNAGLVAPAALAQKLGLAELIDDRVRLPDDAVGAAASGAKAMTVIGSMLAGGNCIDDVDVLRSGAAAELFDDTRAPSTIGTWLRGFIWATVRMLDAASRQVLARAWQAGLGPDTVKTGITAIRRAIAAIPDVAWTPIPCWIDGGADVPETTYTAFKGTRDKVTLRLVVRRVRPTPGSQLALDVVHDYHAILTDRDEPLLQLEADHRVHAVVELAIRDLKAGGPAHVSSGEFGANAAWLGLAVLAHNLGRWTPLAAAGPGWSHATVKTLSDKLISMPVRLVHTARKLKLRTPTSWPWADALPVLTRPPTARTDPSPPRTRPLAGTGRMRPHPHNPVRATFLANQRRPAPAHPEGRERPFLDR